MIRKSLAITVLLFVTGCAPKLIGTGWHGPLLQDERSLWRLTIGNAVSPKFTGLLALRSMDGGVELVLLDRSGIKLLAEKVGRDGRVETHSVVPPVKEKGLPDFLGQGVFRIFMNEHGGGREPCGSGFLVRRCYGEDEEGRIVKSASFGPFRLWSAHYFINKDRDVFHLSGVRLDQGWPRPDIILQRMEP